MDLNGMIYTSISVDAFQVIQKLGQDIGVIDKSGTVVGRIEGDKIVEYSLDIFDQVEKSVLYDQPFDVKFASTLISLYQQTAQYMKLQAQEISKSKDYKTAYRLEIKPRNR